LANSVNGGLLSLVHVLGPVLGSVIYANTESLKWIVMINAGTYALSAAILFNLRYKRTEPATSSHEGFVRSLAAGFSYVRGEKDLLCILLTLMTSGTAIGLLVPLLRPFIEEVLHGTDRTYGQIIGAFGAGGIVGPLAGYWAGRRLGLGKTLLVAFFVEALLLILWSRIGSIPLSCAVLFVWGVVIFTMIPCYMSYVHTYARPEYMGRVFALLDQSHFMPQILGASLIIILGNYLPSQLILTCAGIAYLLVVLMMRPTPGARLLRSRTGAHDSAANPPSATPDSERLNL
ncbi:MFS transporter, partial [Candidatus Sumerlaeota bacterium]|nr:MFS transporter [Candidatus Sumerlaeota bacterium]